MALKFVMHRDEIEDLALAFTNQDLGAATLENPLVSIWDGTTDVSTTLFTVSAVAVSTTALTDEKGNTIPTGQAVVFTLAPKSGALDKLYTVRAEADVVSTSRHLIAQNSDGSPPTVLIGIWAEPA